MNNQPKNTEVTTKKGPATVREPLFHIVKRDTIPWYKAWAVRAAAVLIALVVCAVLITLLSGKNPFEVYKAMFDGAFGTKRRIWALLQELVILLCVALAVTPAFKMQFWNIGAEGQVLMGGLATATIMFYLGGKMPTPVLWVLMILGSIVAGAVWGLIPALFKAKWNTNETLFTLMMNYIATQLVLFCLCNWAKDGSGVLRPMKSYALPLSGSSNNYLLNIIVVAVLTVIMFIYLKYSKQGYEISVVGQSQNTARYIGINVKKVIVRTMIISGVLCGVAGLLLVGGTNYTISSATAGGRGFTAIMVSWLGKFNPFYMILTSFLIAFLSRGSLHIASTFRLSEDLANIITGIILLFIIGCEFFINYKLVFRRKGGNAK